MRKQLRNTKRSTLRVLLLAGTSLALLLAAQAAQTGQEAARAQELLAQARTALGGEAQFKAIQSLSVSGSTRRITGMGEIDGDMTIDIQMPDKFRKSDAVSPMAGVDVTTTQIVNGGEASIDVESNGGGSGMMFNQMGGRQATPEMKAMAERGVRLEYARTMILLLLVSPGGFPVEFRYAGEEDNSGKMADVLEAKGPENFAARLYLDQKTHQPVMLSYKERARTGMQFRAGGGEGESREEMQKKAQEAMAKNATAVEDVEVQLRVVDYKTTSGISFPHKVTKTTAGNVSEEREYSKYKINPALKPERFKKKEEK
jgi:hypothetical protein